MTRTTTTISGFFAYWRIISGTAAPSRSASQPPTCPGGHASYCPCHLGVPPCRLCSQMEAESGTLWLKCNHAVLLTNPHDTNSFKNCRASGVPSSLSYRTSAGCTRCSEGKSCLTMATGRCVTRPALCSLSVAWPHPTPLIVASQYGGRPFKIPLLSGWVVVVSHPEVMEDLKTRPESQLWLTQALMNVSALA